MKRIVCFLVLSFISVAALPQKLASSLLWEVSGNGLKSPSYLFGTYHLVGKTFLDTLKGVLDKVDKSTVVVGEVRFEGEEELARKMMPFMMMKDSTLDQVLTGQEFAEVDSFSRKYAHISLPAFNTFKPTAVQLVFLNFMLPKTLDKENRQLDMFIQEYGKKQGKEVLGLETVEEQAAFLFNVPLDRQKELLLKTVRESDRVINEGKTLYELYKAQNLTGIELLIQQNKDISISEMETLLLNRNRAWMQKMPPLFSAGSTFFAVGAAHLVGEHGLIAQLRKKGYKVRAISAR